MFLYTAKNYADHVTKWPLPYMIMRTNVFTSHSFNPFTPTDRYRSIQNNEWKGSLKLLSVERVNWNIFLCEPMFLPHTALTETFSSPSPCPLLSLTPPLLYTCQPFLLVVSFLLLFCYCYNEDKIVANNTIFIWREFILQKQFKLLISLFQPILLQIHLLLNSHVTKQ